MPWPLRTDRDRGVAAQFHLVGQQRVERLLAVDHHQHFGRRRAGLQAEAGRAHGVEGRAEPFAGLLIAHHQHAGTARTAEDESGLEHLRIDQHALRPWREPDPRWRNPCRWRTTGASRRPCRPVGWPPWRRSVSRHADESGGGQAMAAPRKHDAATWNVHGGSSMLSRKPRHWNLSPTNYGHSR